METKKNPIDLSQMTAEEKKARFMQPIRFSERLRRASAPPLFRLRLISRVMSQASARWNSKAALPKKSIL